MHLEKINFETQTFAIFTQLTARLQKLFNVVVDFSWLKGMRGRMFDSVSLKSVVILTQVYR